MYFFRKFFENKDNDEVVITFNENILNISKSGKNLALTFPDWVEKAFVFNSRILVQFSFKNNQTKNSSNIICLDLDGNKLWSIEKPKYSPQSPFIGMYIADNNKVEVVNWDSYVYKLNIDNGKISCPRFTK